MAIEILLMGNIKDAEAYRAVSEQMCTAAENEPGTLRYEWHASPDGKSINIDVYRDADAFLAHFGAANESGALDKFMAAIDLERVEVIGEVSEEAGAVLGDLNANIHDHVASMSVVSVEG
jgi:quinol monooxygenase YgiN